MRYQGKITNWKDEQGFGFIAPNGGGRQVFVHIRSFSKCRRRPVGNEIVTYELKTDAKGRAYAEAVAFVGEPRSKAATSGNNILSLLTVVFVAFVAGAVFSGRLPFVVLGLYLVASAIAFGAYAFDKSAARNDQWRTQESTLHFFALVGGWPGALAAQKLLRHKSRKQSFQIVFWFTVALNCGALGWLMTPTGNEALNSVLAGL